MNYVFKTAASVVHKKKISFMYTSFFLLLFCGIFMWCKKKLRGKNIGLNISICNSIYLNLIILWPYFFLDLIEPFFNFTDKSKLTHIYKVL